MPLERHELEAIQAETCADDIEIPDAACAWRHCKRAGHLQPSGRERYALIEGDDQCPSTTQARLETLERAVSSALTAALPHAPIFEVMAEPAWRPVPNATAAASADFAASILVVFYAKVRPGHPDYHVKV